MRLNWPDTCLKVRKAGFPMSTPAENYCTGADTEDSPLLRCIGEHIRVWTTSRQLGFSVAKGWPQLAEGRALFVASFSNRYLRL